MERLIKLLVLHGPEHGDAPRTRFLGVFLWWRVWAFGIIMTIATLAVIAAGGDVFSFFFGAAVFMFLNQLINGGE